MAWAIITIYISKCAQMNPQQLPKTSKFYSRCKKCDIEKTLGGWVPPPLGSPKVKNHLVVGCAKMFLTRLLFCKLLKSIFISVFGLGAPPRRSFEGGLYKFSE